MNRRRPLQPDEAAESVLDLVRLISNLPEIEGVKLYGVPPVELDAILGFLGRAPNPECPNLKRLEILSSPISDPRLLLAGLASLLAARKEAGVPLQSVTVRVKCETLIPAEEHCAFLNSWESLVAGGVAVEYRRKLLRRSRRIYPEGNKDEGGNEDEDEGGDGEVGDEYEDEDEEGKDEGGGGDGAGDAGSWEGWDGWPENWPKTVEEMRGS